MSVTRGPRMRAVLSSIPAYVPGKPAEAGGAVTPSYKLSSNENPYPPLPGVVEVLARAATEVNRYPDMANGDLVAAVSASLGLPADRIVPGTGSVGALIQLLQAFVEPGDEVVHAWRSFEAYPIVVGLTGAQAVPVPLGVGARHDLEALAGAVTGRTRVVLLCTPNNPTGTTIRQAEFDAFMSAVPEDVLVVLDEAYVEFVRDPEAVDGLAAHRAHPNVALLRTFSKAYGLAGLRVGYAVAHEPYAEGMRKTAVPFGVSGPAQAAAVASLAAVEALSARVDALVAERDRVLTALVGVGWEVPESHANFFWLELGDATPAFARACQRAGVSVRPFGLEGARCTIGEPEANDLLIEVCVGFGPGRSGGAR